MKKIFFCALIIQSLFFAVFSEPVDSYTKDKIVADIQRPQAPLVKDQFLVFTANNDARYVGIAFDYENFRTIHSFERLVLRDIDDKVSNSLLFYIVQVPKNIKEVSYRLVIDGMWTTDPLNSRIKYDTRTDMMLSSVIIDREPDNSTSLQDSGLVRFVYEGNPGERIRLAGSFNNWDSFMYYLSEVSPGQYQIELPLPAGTYYYTFFKGTKAVLDPKNSNRAYTLDGRTASVISLK